MSNANKTTAKKSNAFIPMTHQSANYEALLMHGTLADVLALAIALTDSK